MDGAPSWVCIVSAIQAVLRVGTGTVGTVHLSRTGSVDNHLYPLRNGYWFGDIAGDREMNKAWKLPQNLQVIL